MNLKKLLRKHKDSVDLTDSDHYNEVLRQFEFRKELENNSFNSSKNKSKGVKK